MNPATFRIQHRLPEEDRWRDIGRDYKDIQTVKDARDYLKVVASSFVYRVVKVEEVITEVSE